MATQILMYFLIQYLVLSFQVPSASSPCVPVLLASTLSFPVTHRIFTACLMILAMVTAGLCSAHGEALVSPSLLASFALWHHLFSHHADPTAPSQDRRMALSVKAWTYEKNYFLDEKKQAKKTFPCLHWFTDILVTFFYLCVFKNHCLCNLDFF